VDPRFITNRAIALISALLVIGSFFLAILTGSGMLASATQAGGLGVILVIPDDPEVLGLPADPDPPLMASAWQGFVQPVSIGLIGVTAVGMGVAGVIARRNHMAELKELEAAEATAGSEDP
jgi:hypothetical protein